MTKLRLGLVPFYERAPQMTEHGRTQVIKIGNVWKRQLETVFPTQQFFLERNVDNDSFEVITHIESRNFIESECPTVWSDESVYLLTKLRWLWR